MVRRRASRAVSNHGSKLRLAAILRDALSSLGLLRMRSEVVERFTGSEAGIQGRELDLRNWIPASKRDERN
jgi:hypothetical protein